MVSSVNVASKALTMACDILGALNAVTVAYRSRGEQDEVIFAKACAVNRLALLGFSSVEIGMLASGVKANPLLVLKVIELFPRIGQIGLQFASEVVSPHPFSMVEGEPFEETVAKRIMRIVSKGLVAPIADFFRVNAEISGYSEQRYLEILAKDPTAKRPIYEPDNDGGFKIVGERPIDAKECETAIEEARNVAAVSSIVRATAEMDFEGPAVGTASVVYGQLARFMRNALAFIPAHERNEDENDRIDWTNLVALDVIPDPLAEDEIFQRYICPITLRAIRHPVLDPNGVTLYERSAIEGYLRGERKPSPITHQMMSREDLGEAGDIQAIIDARLRQHQQRFAEFIQHEARRLPENHEQQP